MDSRKVCYFEILSGEHDFSLVRFGMSRRSTAQVVTDQATWEKIAKSIRADGYQLIEIRPNGIARVS